MKQTIRPIHSSLIGKHTLRSSGHGTSKRSGNDVHSAALRFGVLGAIEAWHDSTPVDPCPPERRILLARLLLGNGQPVSVERLCRDLGPADDRPAAAVSTAHGLDVPPLVERLSISHGELLRLWSELEHATAIRYLIQPRPGQGKP
ncbi:hypothetical protein ABZV67_37945 [Streptomyces sp. NPDC005065]|uniref:hypothetical protein n=1 Tax=Streptomyces sp. NPDC005065 TaxID=3154461 RepID=UPI0033AE4E8A